jgi:SAM-dependent methyltransferase
MNPPIISLQHWLHTAPGHYLLAWEQAQLDQAVVNLFGFNALQLGLPELQGLRANRMPHRWVALPEELLTDDGSSAGLFAGESPPKTVEGLPVDGPFPESGAAALSAPAPVPRVALVTDAAALPFPAASLDLVVLPHTLELSADPHQVLREVERVLVPEGRVVICGLNPTSLWGLRQGRAQLARRLGLGGWGLGQLYLPDAGEFIGPWRLRDWLRLLGFEMEFERFGCYRPALHTAKWLQRTAWMDAMGERWWPIFGAVYFFVAVKRVHGVRLLGPSWKPRRVTATAPVSVANFEPPCAAARRPSEGDAPCGPAEPVPRVPGAGDTRSGGWPLASLGGPWQQQE